MQVVVPLCGIVAGCAGGIALGFDRLVMLATGAPTIEHVLWSPVPLSASAAACTRFIAPSVPVYERSELERANPGLNDGTYRLSPRAEWRSFVLVGLGLWAGGLAISFLT